MKNDKPNLNFNFMNKNTSTISRQTKYQTITMRNKVDDEISSISGMYKS